MNKQTNACEAQLWCEFCAQESIWKDENQLTAELLVEGTHFEVSFDDVTYIYRNPILGVVVTFNAPYGEYDMREGMMSGDSPCVSKITYRVVRGRALYFPHHCKTALVHKEAHSA